MSYRCNNFSVVPHIPPSFSQDVCFRALGYPRVAFLTRLASVIFSSRAFSENSRNRGSRLFGEGSIAYDRSFA